eukprot:scaffold14362_cov142-Isochrysis_galbana.AAC.4
MRSGGAAVSPGRQYSGCRLQRALLDYPRLPVRGPRGALKIARRERWVPRWRRGHTMSGAQLSMLRLVPRPWQRVGSRRGVRAEAKSEQPL